MEYSRPVQDPFIKRGGPKLKKLFPDADGFPMAYDWPYRKHTQSAYSQS